MRTKRDEEVTHETRNIEPSVPFFVFPPTENKNTFSIYLFCLLAFSLF